MPRAGGPCGVRGAVRGGAVRVEHDGRVPRAGVVRRRLPPPGRLSAVARRPLPQPLVSAPLNIINVNVPIDGVLLEFVA